MNPALQPNRNVPPPPPSAVNTGINTGKPPAPAAPAGPPTGIAATMAAMQNMPQQAAFTKAIEDARKSVEGTSREQKIKDELDKCVLLCANCHLELHDQEILDKYKNPS
jgi:hypothetical protein